MPLLTKNRASEAIKYLPSGMQREITRLSLSRAGGEESIREIRVRAEGVSSVQYGDRMLRLSYPVTAAETEQIFLRLCDGSLYAHRDTVIEGYISIDGGIRVGVCGTVKYDGEAAVGISDITTLLFRIPGGECEFKDELTRVFRAGIGRGMIIYSPPGVGKTTALRALAAEISVGDGAKRVAVVDSRCEFVREDYIGCQVDLLRGYKKSVGIEIATRTLSPDLIIVDELGARDTEAVYQVLNSGVPLVATAHSSSLGELLDKGSLGRIFELSAFEVFVGIERREGIYSLRVDRL